MSVDRWASAHWPRLDAFEGPGYRRVSIPATLADGSVVQAQIYALNRAA